jgi:hypothetical protein
VIKIIFTPLGQARFDARSQEGVLCQASRTPFLDAARALLASGCDPNATIEMWHAGAEGYSLRSSVGIAAKLAVHERGRGAHPPIFALWESFPSTGDRPPAAADQSEVALPPSLDAAVLADTRGEP